MIRPLAISKIHNGMKSALLKSMDPDVAHDLRSPLASIEGYARLLLDGRGGNLLPKQRSYVEGILASSRIFYHVLDSLRLADEIQSGAVTLNQGSAPAGEILYRTAAGLARAFAAKGALVKTEADGVVIPRSAEVLERAVGMLLLAALTTSAEGSEVHLSAQRAEKEIVVAVEAPGIHGPGLGAGLDVVACLASRLGGRTEFSTGRLALILPA